MDVHNSCLNEVDKKNRELALLAATSDPMAFQFVDDRFKADKKFVKAVIQATNGATIEYASDAIKKDKEIALLAVKKQGYALREVDTSLKKDKDVVLAAILENSGALQFADDSIKKDKEIKLAFGATYQHFGAATEKN